MEATVPLGAGYSIKINLRPDTEAQLSAALYSMVDLPNVKSHKIRDAALVSA